MSRAHALLLLWCLQLLAVTSCGDGDSPPGPSPAPAPPRPVASVTVTPESGILAVGQTLQLTAGAKDDAGSTLVGRVVVWTSSDTSIANVNATGLVTAMGAGDATITATTEGHSGAAALIVTGSEAGLPTVYTDRRLFQRATASLGTPTIVDFDDIDARPVTDTIEGRRRFNGSRYARQGFTFASPDGYDLYIAPGGLQWNASNSLSVGRFPFDPLDPGGDPADSLVVTLNPRCNAVSLQIVDNGTQNPTEGVEFVGSRDVILSKADLPADDTAGRAFIGVVSRNLVVTQIRVLEDATDGDDVTYDDFVCFRAR